ncbi:hypothetical protein B0H11DRAFT_1796507 [Mycena galericulata]|nr:hypothetical protein B0H11DRAFT_1796507 [Mycena galericulata]
MGLFQPFVPPLPESLSFSGKSALVTGANSGLGLAACFQLVQRHISTLILAVRNNAAGEATRTALLADPIVRALPTKPTILIYDLDLARPSSVAAFASKVLAEVPALHILLLNAGIGTLAWGTTPETHAEQMFQINYVSNALLCVRLLPLLRRTAETSGAPSHLTIVGSRMQQMHSLKEHPVPVTSSVFAFFNDRANYVGTKRYGDSKLLVSMFVRELAKRVDGKVVTVNNLCPGMVRTNLNAKAPWWLRALVGAVFALRARAPEVGGRILIYGASAGTETHGEMLADYEVWHDNTFLETKEGQELEKRLWEETVAAAESFAPGSVREAALED